MRVRRARGRAAGPLPLQCATKRTIPDNKAAEMLDSLDKALIIFEHPANASSRPRAIFRRVDLVFSSWQSFGSAVVGWTGSTQFERDLRQRATDLRLRFDSGGIRNDQDMSQIIPALTERDVFRVLQIDYLREPSYVTRGERARC